MRAPQSAGDNVSVLSQETPVGLDARFQQLGAFRHLALHFCDQAVADFRIESGSIGVACRGACHGNSTAGDLVQAKGISRARKLEIDEVKTIRDNEPDRARQLFGDLLQTLPDQIPQLQALHHRGAHRHRAWTNAVFLVARQIDELPHAGQRMREARHRRSR